MSAGFIGLPGFELPPGWCIVPLPDYAFFQEGPGLRRWQWTDAGMKVINGRNVLTSGRIDTTNTARFISMEEFLTRYSHFGVEDGDILVTSSGTIGKVARIGSQDLPIMMNTSVIRFHPRCQSTLDAGFLYAFLRSPTFQTQIHTFATGAAQPNFGPAHLKQTWMALPPFAMQRKIAAILSAYDDLIENNTRRIAILEEIARSLYREWIVNFRFPGHDGVRMMESAIGPIPEGWEVCKASDAILVSAPTRVPKEGEKLFVPMGGLSENSMLIHGIERRSGNGGSKFKNGDTLFARITPCLENGKTGFVQFLPSNDAVAFGSTEFIVLRSHTLIPECVYLMARSSEFRDNAIKSMSGATGRQRVREECFDKFLFAHPDTRTLGLFAEHVSPVFRQIFLLGGKIAALRRTRDFLLPKLVSGEIDVSELDVDLVEDASA